MSAAERMNGPRDSLELQRASIEISREELKDVQRKPEIALAETREKKYEEIKAKSLFGRVASTSSSLVRRPFNRVADFVERNCFHQLIPTIKDTIIHAIIDVLPESAKLFAKRTYTYANASLRAELILQHGETKGEAEFQRLKTELFYRIAATWIKSCGWGIYEKAFENQFKESAVKGFLMKPLLPLIRRFISYKIIDKDEYQLPQLTSLFQHIDQAYKVSETDVVPEHYNRDLEQASLYKEINQTLSGFAESGITDQYSTTITRSIQKYLDFAKGYDPLTGQVNAEHLFNETKNLLQELADNQSLGQYSAKVKQLLPLAKNYDPKTQKVEYQKLLGDINALLLKMAQNNDLGNHTGRVQQYLALTKAYKAVGPKAAGAILGAGIIGGGALIGAGAVGLLGVAGVVGAAGIAGAVAAGRMFGGGSRATEAIIGKNLENIENLGIPGGLPLTLQTPPQLVDKKNIMEIGAAQKAQIEKVAKEWKARDQKMRKLQEEIERLKIPLEATEAELVEKAQTLPNKERAFEEENSRMQKAELQIQSKQHKTREDLKKLNELISERKRQEAEFDGYIDLDDKEHEFKTLREIIELKRSEILAKEEEQIRLAKLQRMLVVRKDSQNKHLQEKYRLIHLVSSRQQEATLRSLRKDLGTLEMRYTDEIVKIGEKDDELKKAIDDLKVQIEGKEGGIESLTSELKDELNEQLDQEGLNRAERTKIRKELNAADERIQAEIEALEELMEDLEAKELERAILRQDLDGIDDQKKIILRQITLIEEFDHTDDEYISDESFQIANKLNHIKNMEEEDAIELYGSVVLWQEDIQAHLEMVEILEETDPVKKDALREKLSKQIEIAQAREAYLAELLREEIDEVLEDEGLNLDTNKSFVELLRIEKLISEPEIFKRSVRQIDTAKMTGFAETALMTEISEESANPASKELEERIVANTKARLKKDQSEEILEYVGDRYDPIGVAPDFHRDADDLLTEQIKVELQPESGLLSWLYEMATGPGDTLGQLQKIMDGNPRNLLAFTQLLNNEYAKETGIEALKEKVCPEESHYDYYLIGGNFYQIRNEELENPEVKFRVEESDTNTVRVRIDTKWMTRKLTPPKRRLFKEEIHIQEPSNESIPLEKGSSIEASLIFNIKKNLKAEDDQFFNLESLKVYPNATIEHPA